MASNENSSDMTMSGVPEHYDFDEIERVFDSRILSYKDTLVAIAQPGISLARFGDGELKQLFRGYNIGFQPFSTDLQNDLRKVITSPLENVLIGFPPVFRNEQWAKLWRDILPETKALFSNTKTFANTAVSRPPCFTELGPEAVALWRDVWHEKSICVVTGEGSRFDLHPELFDNAKRIDFIRTVPVDAYGDLARILGAVESGEKYDKYLISLGSAGTVLAYKLASRGLDALDIGHLSGSFSHVVLKGTYPEKMPLTR